MNAADGNRPAQGDGPPHAVVGRVARSAANTYRLVPVQMWVPTLITRPDESR